jgi:hypothetical protein
MSQIPPFGKDFVHGFWNKKTTLNFGNKEKAVYFKAIEQTYILFTNFN